MCEFGTYLSESQAGEGAEDKTDQCCGHHHDEIEMNEVFVKRDQKQGMWLLCCHRREWGRSFGICPHKAVVDGEH